MIKIQNIPLTPRTYLYRLKHFKEKLYTKEDSSKITTFEVLSQIPMRKKISKQHLTFVRLIDLDIMTFVFLCRSCEVSWHPNKYRIFRQR